MKKFLALINVMLTAGRVPRGARVAAVTAFVWAAMAAGAAAYPLGETSVTPASGSKLTAGYSSPTIEFTAPNTTGLRNVVVEVTSANVPGQDGTLADDYRVGFGILHPRDSAPQTFTGTVDGEFVFTPGTYYFQFSGTRYPSLFGGACPGGEQISCLFTSQVYTLTVGSPPAASTPTAGAPTTPRLSLAHARGVVRSAIRQETHRAPHKLKYRCSRADRTTVKCRSSWWDRVHVWAVTVTAERDGSDLYYSGRGLRAKHRCLRYASVKRCARTVRW